MWGGEPNLIGMTPARVTVPTMRILIININIDLKICVTGENRDREMNLEYTIGFGAGSSERCHGFVHHRVVVCAGYSARF